MKMIFQLFFPGGKVFWRNFLLSMCLALLPVISGAIFYLQRFSYHLSLTPDSFIYPAWFLVVCWILCYVLLGFSFYRTRISNALAYLKRRAFLLFALQVLLNIFYVLDFLARDIKPLSPLKLYVLFLLAGLSIINFYQADKKAAWLFTPYAFCLVFLYMVIF